jgi:hypothetical protein
VDFPAAETILEAAGAVFMNALSTSLNLTEVVTIGELVARTATTVIHPARQRHLRPLLQQGRL